jgi:hypothetical protein
MFYSIRDGVLPYGGKPSDRECCQFAGIDLGNLGSKGAAKNEGTPNARVP